MPAPIGGRQPIVLPQLGRPTRSLEEAPPTADSAGLVDTLNQKWGALNKRGVSAADGAWLLALANHPNADNSVYQSILAKLDTATATPAATTSIAALKTALQARVAGADFNAGGGVTQGPAINPGVTVDGGAAGGIQTDLYGTEAPKKPASNYTVNFAAVNAEFNRGANPATKPEDLFSTLVPNPLGGPPTQMATHYKEGEPITLIAYDNALGPKQDDITRFLAPGEVMIAVKHHKPEHPVLGGAGKEEVKLDSTHIELAVGVNVKNDDGTTSRGAITLNNPQNYEGGLFGTADYPMIFLKLKFPPGLNEADKTAYMDNFRTWLTIANTFTNFPGEYNGGDPLGTRSPSQIKEIGDQLIKAMTGSPAEQTEAKAWLASSDHKVYCAELAHVALNLGLTVPLNKATLGEERFAAVNTALESKDFLAANGNQYARMVDLTMAPESLRAVHDKLGLSTSEPSAAEPFGKGLAVRPMTLTSMVEEFISSMATRDLGRPLTAAEAQSYATKQSELFRGARPGIAEIVGLDAMPAGDPRRQGLEALLNGIQAVLATPFTDYAQFRATLDPLMAQAAQVSGPRPNGMGAFMPPSAWLLHALDRADNTGGVMGVEVVGHGLHASLLNKKEGVE